MNEDNSADAKNLGPAAAKTEKLFSVNAPDQHGNTPLHNAVSQENEKMLADLLKNLHIDLGSRNRKGETPLLLALRMSKPHSFIMQLISSGSDLNAINNFGQNSLHVALLCSSLDIAHELVKRGTNIDAQDFDNRTPLLYAIESNDDLEAVCMLLYYGADVTILCVENMTPLSHALRCNKMEIAEALLNYYDEFSDADLDGYTALHYAIWHGSSIALDLVKAGADVNTVTSEGQDILRMAIEKGDIQLCKLISPTFDFRLLLNSDDPFLEKEIHTILCYLGESSSSSEWLDFLYLLLNSPVAHELIDELRNYCAYGDHYNFSSILYEFLDTKLNVTPGDRLKIILIMLSLGVEISIGDINTAFILYGFTEIVESLLYCTDTYCKQDFHVYSTPYGLFPQVNFAFSLENDFSNANGTVFQMCCYLLDCPLYYKMNTNILLKFIFKNLSFFSLPSQIKQQLMQNHKHALEEAPEVHEMLKFMPEVPSLLELSRNQSCNFIKQSFQINRAYQYHDVVKKLNLPNYIRDILRFKVPVYG